MDITALQKFCGDGESNFAIGSPFNKGNWTYATNGHICIRVAAIPDIRTDGPNAEALFDKQFKMESPSSVAVELPVVIEESEECETCEGDGGKHHSCPDCQCDCEECGGSGTITSNSDKNISVQIGDVCFAAEYIRLMLTLPGLMVNSSPESAKALSFKFDGGEGMLTPLRTPRDKNITAA